MSDFKAFDAALQSFHTSVAQLKQLDILINKKDFTCQIGEWFVEKLYDGKRSRNGIQKHWDVEIDGKFVQVKSHAKASTNSASWTAVKYDSNAKIDELIIVVFFEDYKLKAFYKVPWNIALKKITPSGGRNVINWNSVSAYKIENHNLPKQELVKLFT